MGLSYSAPGIDFSETNCLTTFGACDPSTHSITITCVEQDILNFDTTITIQSIINIPEDIIPNDTIIQDVQVWTQFDHTFVADLQSFLWHENKTTTLFGNDVGNGGCTENNVNVILSDNSTNMPFEDGRICDPGPGGINGHHRPVTPLSVYNGLNANGNWYFYVHDRQSEDHGRFGNWSITLTLDDTFCTESPTNDPTVDPTIEPTMDPTSDPTMQPTSDPTNEPTTASPSSDPSIDPTVDPTTARPTEMPTLTPTETPVEEGQIDEVPDDNSGDDGFENNNEHQNETVLGINHTIFLYIIGGAILLFCCFLIFGIVFCRTWRKKNELEKRVKSNLDTNQEEKGHNVAINMLPKNTDGNGTKVTQSNITIGEGDELNNNNSDSNKGTSSGPMANIEMVASDEDGLSDDSESVDDLWTGHEHNNTNMKTPNGVDDTMSMTPIGTDDGYLQNNGNEEDEENINDMYLQSSDHMTPQNE